jgi:ribosomal protein S1
MSWSTHLRSAQDFVKVGDVVEAVILTLDRDDRKMVSNNCLKILGLISLLNIQ